MTILDQSYVQAISKPNDYLSSFKLKNRLNHKLKINFYASINYNLFKFGSMIYILFG